MPLKSEYNGDITKAPGARVLVSRNKETGAFVGLYGFTADGTYVRANRCWITAPREARRQANMTRATPVTPEFVDVFDDLDEKGKTPTDAQIKRHAVSVPK